MSLILFDTYVDELSLRLNRAGIGCNIDEKPASNYRYVDDLALLATSGSAPNDLLKFCNDFT